MASIGKRVHSQVDLVNRELRKNTNFSGLIEAFVDAQGEIQYRSTFDGYTGPDIKTVHGHIAATNINAFQTFTEGQISGRKGIGQIADEIDLLNERLKNLKPAQRKQLERLGLKEFIGQDVTMTRAQFQYGSDLKELEKILAQDYVKNAGILNVTDEGVTVINYSVNNQLLSSKQAKMLNNALGLGNITDRLSKQLASGEFKSLAKVPKRMQGLLAERDISLTGESVKNLLDEKGGAFIYDDVSAFFKGMLDFNLLSEEERFIMAHGLGFSEKEIKSISQDIDMSRATAKRVRASVESKVSFQQALKDEYKKATKMTDAEFERFQNLLKESKDDFDQLTTKQKQVYKGDFLELFKQKVKGLGKSSDEADRAFGISIQKTLDASIEKFRDGTFVSNVKVLDQFIDNIKGQMSSITDQAKLLTEADMEEYNSLKNQLESLMHLKESGQEGLDSAIARLAFPGGQGKGEMFLRKFGWLPKGLRDKLIYMPQSAVKREIGSEVSSIALNVAKSHKEQVYSDPLALLYHQEYFGKPEFMQGVRKNVANQMEAIQKFMDTGLLTEDVRKNVIGAINSQLEEDIPFNKLTAGARASQLRNREEARAIKEMLESGVDPRQIPALVRRITDYYQTQAFRIKQTSKGERVDVVMPNVQRRSIKTYESILDPAIGKKDFESIRINITSLGEEGQKIFKALGGEIGAAPEVNFMQFRLRGQNMLISGVNAHLYHHSLGTFDLDDKGVPMMNTFKGADGKDRFAFMTLRQPTGFQEKIFQQADLSDAETLRQTIEFFNGDFKGLLNDATVGQRLATTEKEKRILGVLKEASSGKKDINLRNLSSDDINKFMMDLINSDEALNKYGFSKLVGMSSESLLEMAVTGSASPLGLDKIIRVMSEGETNPQKLQKILEEIGVTKDRMPQYTSGNFVNLITEEQVNVQNTVLVEEYNRMHGTRFRTIKELNDYVFDETKTTASQRSDRLIRLKSAQAKMIENLQTTANIDIENSLGLYMNRQSFAAAMSSQIEEAISLIGGSNDLADYYRAAFSVGIIPPSEAVDVSKSLIGKSMVQALEMQKLAVAIGEMSQAGENISLQAVEQTLKRLGKAEIKLGAAGEEALSQTSRGVGFLRALQVGAGTIDESEQIGYDMAIFGQGSYSRISSDQDVKQVILDTVEGAKRARALKLNQNAAQEEIDRIDSFISEIENMDDKAALQKLSLKSGTRAYERFAVVSQMSEESIRIRNLIEGQKSIAMKRARAARDPYQAVATAEHMSAVEQIVDSRRSDLDTIRRLISLDKDDADLQIQKALQKTETNTFFYEALSAMKEKNSQVNMLDLIDTLEAQINSTFDETTSKIVLNARTSIVDGEDQMIRMITDARTRRIQRKALRSSSVEAYDVIASSARSYGYDQLEQVGEDVAKSFLKERAQTINELTRLAEEGDIGSARMLEAMNRPDSLYDFMRLSAGEITLPEERLTEGSQISRDAEEAYRRITAQRELDRLETEYNGSNATRKVLSGSDISDEARTLIDNIDAADEITSVRRGTYKRFGESLKNGALKEVFQDKLIRNSAYAVAGLAAFGFIYSARKDKEFTQEKASGPPLLPGGSAYETDTPRNLPSLSDLKYLNPVVAGMQYKINVMGSQQDMEKMQYLAGNVVGGPVDSTMYSSLPPLGKDPYSQVASRY